MSALLPTLVGQGNPVLQDSESHTQLCTVPASTKG